MAWRTKFICPFCGEHLKSEMYARPMRMENFCDNCGKFISNIDIPSKVYAECEATCESRTVVVARN